eukprot:258336-Rhodomonas_salina.1
MGVAMPLASIPSPSQDLEHSLQSQLQVAAPIVTACTFRVRHVTALRASEPVRAKSCDPSRDCSRSRA